jgi:prolyl oligopeptidase
MAGSDWQEWKVRDIESGKDLEDHVKWIKFLRRLMDARQQRFFYSRYDEPESAEKLRGANYFHKIYFHKLGTPQSEDVLVYERPDHKDWLMNAASRKTAAISSSIFRKGATRRTASSTRSFEARRTVVELLNKADAEYSFIGNDGSVFWFPHQPEGAARPHHRDRHNEPEEIRELVPQSDEKLEGVQLVAERFVANSLKDAHTTGAAV